jgi:uncharacterized membrane protein (UPF0127 family)
MAVGGKRSLRLVHPGSGRVLAERLERPRTFVGRGLGLMFRRGLEPGSGIWITPCSGIHTFFMRFPIDVVFLDRGRRVFRVYRALPSWRMVPMVWGAHSVVELPAGTVDALPLAPGEQLAVEDSGQGERA